MMLVPEIFLKSIELPNGETLGYRESGNGKDILLLIHGDGKFAS